MTKEEMVEHLNLASTYINDASPHSAIRILDVVRKELVGWADVQDTIIDDMIRYEGNVHND